MKKINFSIQSKLLQKQFFCLLASFFIMVQFASGQCVLSVNEMTNVSLDQNCMGVVTPEMVGNTSQCTSGDIHVVLKDANDVQLPDNTVGADQIGETITVMLIDSISMNSSWGYLNVEDKLDPTIECEDPTGPIYCYTLDTFEPVVDDNCGEVELLVTNLGTIINPCNDTTFMDDEVLRRVTRSYVAVDAQGRMSEPCIFTFDVLRVPSFDVITPAENFLVQSMTNLSCDGDYPVDEDGHPAPIDTALGGTGAPMFDSLPLYPIQDTLCNIIVDYDDTVLPAIGCVTKIMRTWTILEWSCADAQRDTTLLQMIEIKDSEGPTFECPSNMVSSTNSNGCAATVLLPSISPVDNCSDQFTYNISWGLGSITTNGGLAQLPTGKTMVTYIAYDECLNPSEPCVIEVDVQDLTPPVAICDQYTTVSLTSNGLAQVPATVFDDGSYDECEFDKVLVRRMDTTCDGFELEDEIFADYIHFCCEDVGTSVMVVMRAYDKAGNYNDCMVNVEVQDKVAPTLSCPANETHNCDYVYDLENLDAFFGEATSGANCSSAPIIHTYTTNLNQCNIGTITRNFSVTNDGGTASCSQTITFVAVEPFNENDDAIEWPGSVTLDGCDDPTNAAYGPDNTGYPTFIEGACDLVGANWEDQVFPFNNSNGDACFKILRTWKVIDWCQFTTNSQTGATEYPQWDHVQVIKVNDSVMPEITSSCDRVTVCTYDAQCQEGFIELTSSATDNCTIDLNWSYSIDANNDGTFENTPALTGSGVGSTATATGNYPVGNHRILWSFSDKCGNVTSCEQLFDVENCKAPTPYCLNGLAVDLMPVDEDNDGTVDFGMVELWASDFDAGSYHPCGYEVFLSFEEVTSLNADGSPVLTPNMEFTCNTLGDQDVNIYAVIVTAEGTIIQDFCATFVNVQDNTNACSDDDNRAVITGSITTPMNETLQDVSVSLEGSEMSDEMTNIEGQYAFPSMPLGGEYNVNPTKTDDIRNGVNTMDIVMIQRHLLGLETLDSPYKMIAADVNNDEQIKASDLLTLRKLVLGVINEFPNNDSWRFVDAAFNFPDSEDPFVTALPESYDIDALNSDMEINFVAMKVGDVNNDATLTNNASNEIESTLQINTTNQSFVAGETVMVPLSVKDNADLLGAQFTLNIDNNALSLLSIESESISVDENNVGLTYANDGLVTFSWNDVEEVALTKEEPMAILVFVANTGGSVANSIAISSDITSAQAYDKEFDVMDVRLNIESDENEGFEVYQNNPNPFNELTTISFTIPQAERVAVSIYDMTGKVITTNTTSYEAGTHSVQIDANDIGGSGIYYYQVAAGENQATKKMVIVK